MFEDTKAVAFALDGTVYRGSKLIDGIDEVIRHCRKLGKSVFFLTNNSSETRSQIFHKLRNMGIDCTFREVLTSGYAAALYAHRERLTNIYVCGSKNLVSECEKLSVHSVEPEEAENMLIGLDPEFDYEKLAVASNVALKVDKVIACNKERSYPGEEDCLMPGCGGMVSSVEWCSGRMVDLTIGNVHAQRGQRATRPGIGGDSRRGRQLRHRHRHGRQVRQSRNHHQLACLRRCRERGKRRRAA